MTTWRRNNVEGFDDAKKEENPIENFSSIPLFDVLQNKPEPVIEGMTCAPYDMFCDDYFQKVKLFKGSSCGVGEVTNIMNILMVYITSPVKLVDKALEDSIMDILETYLRGTLMDCNKGEYIKYNNNENDTDFEKTFTWLEEFTNLREGLADYMKNAKPYVGPLDVKDTILNLQTNHPNIDATKLSIYYVNALNAYYTKMNGNLTQNQIFEFNQDIDTNQLNDPDIIKSIGTIPTPSPQPVAAEYSEYMKKYARFLLTSNEPIIHYAFADNYFPMPTKKGAEPTPFAQFEADLKNDFEKGTQTATTGFKAKNGYTKPDAAPTKANSSSDYVYSVNISKPATTPISVYLNKVILYLTFVYISKNPKNTNFTSVLPKMATVYITCINTVEYFKYAAVNQYLTEYEVAMFNHIFYSAFEQTGNLLSGLSANLRRPNTACSSNSVIGGISTYLKQVLITGPLPPDAEIVNMGILKFNGNIINYITQLAPIVCNRTQYISNVGATWYSTSNAITANPQIKTARFPRKFQPTISEYISYVIPDKDISNYYVKDYKKYLQQETCNASNQATMQQFKLYAQTIKQEIYRILMIPIVIYIVYNFYYLFFFKDVFGYAKDTTKEPAEYQKEPNKGCFYPQLPDWEMIFHNMGGKRLNYIFEFIFKPAKLLYTALNAGKTLFHNEWIQNVPYIVFLLGFAVIYPIFYSFGPTLLNIFMDLFNATAFNVPIGLYGLASAIIWIYFIKSFFDSMIPSADNIESWPIWIMKGSSAIGMGIRALLCILYWVIRALITNSIIYLSIFIAIIYCFWVGLCSMFDYTDKDHGYHDKMELMDRVIYTKLYEKTEDDTSGFKWFGKGLFFFALFFITEMVILYTLVVNMKTFNNMPTPTGTAAKVASTAIKSFLHMLCIFLIFLLSLWCVYKYFTKKHTMNDLYNYTDGSHRLNTDSCETTIDPTINNDATAAEKELFQKFLEQYSEDISFFNTSKENLQDQLLSGNKINKIFAEYFKAKTGVKHTRPFMQNMIDKMFRFGKSLTVSQPEGYVEEKGPNSDSIGKIMSFGQNLVKSASAGYKKEMDSWTNTLDSDTNIFLNGPVNPTRKNMKEGVQKLFGILSK